MSVCSNAVGLLAAVACVHIAITIFLGVLVALVLYTSSRNKAAKRRRENEKLVNALMAAGRTLSPNEYSEQDEMDDVFNEESSGETVAQEKSSEDGELSRRETVTNPWIDIDKPKSESDDVECKDKPVILRRIRSPLQLRTVSPLTRTVSPLTRTGSPLTRTGSPLTRSDSPIGELGKKARISIISVASNLSSRFRRSTELSEEEAKLVLSMSPAAVMNDMDDDQVEGELAISGEDRLDERTLDDTRPAAHQDTNFDASNTQMTLTIPWQPSESSC